MITLKVKLYQDSAGALHAEFIDGINSVSQNNAGKNIVEVILNGFELQTEEILQIAYATSLNENDPETENIGFNFMEKRYDTNSWVAEVDPLVLDRRGVWYLGLRVVTNTNGVIQTVSNETEMLEFTVNATLKDVNGKYPTKTDVFALYQTAVNSVAQAGKVASETATQVASEVAENVANEKLTPVIQVTNNELGASLELLLNDKTYELYAVLRAKNYEILSQQKVDLPLEEMIIDAYQNEGGNLVIVLKNGQERTIELGALIKGLVSSSEKGKPNGVASLNAQGQVPSEQLPPLNYLPLTGGTVNGAVEADDFTATSTGFFIGETSYEEGFISHLSNSYAFPEDSGTIALREPIYTQLALINQIISQSGIMYTADNTASWNERITADGLNVLDGSTAILKKVVGNTVAYDKDKNGLNGKLANAFFSGIESTNADDTERSNISYPKTQMALGKTIDFEAQKVTDYGKEFVFDETYNIGVYPSNVGIGVFFSGLGLTDTNPVGVCSDGKVVSEQMANQWRVAFGNIYWYSILDTLGYTATWADKTNPTTDEKNQAIENFKAYLAQRYANGNPVTIRYVSSTLQSEHLMPSTIEYEAYKGGTEKVLYNDGAEYGANNELTINYVYIAEVQ